MEMESAAWAPNEVPRVKRGPLPERKLVKGATPSDDLWSINAVTDLGKPAPMAYRQLWTALSSTKAESEESIPRMISMSSWHIWHKAQAGLWGMMGSGELTDLHESMAPTSPDLEDEGQITRRPPSGRVYRVSWVSGPLSYVPRHTPLSHSSRGASTACVTPSTL